MFLAHAPAGYLAARAFGRAPARALVVACVAGALFPDVDMFWFHFVDDARVHHHRYWTHIPLFWIATAPLLGWHRLGRAFLLGIATHLLLDTIAGDIQWLQPFSDRFVHLVRVPARPGAHWIVSFLLHWTFAFELLLGMTAAFVAFRRTCSRATSRNSSSVSSAPSMSRASAGSSATTPASSSISSSP